MNGREPPPAAREPETPLRRLRDHFGDRADVTNRAGEIIRAVPPPAPLDPHAGARVLGAVRHGPGRGAWWLQRVVLATATLVVAGATAAGAAAALNLIQLSWPPGRPTLAMPASPDQPAHAPAVAPAQSATTDAPPSRGHRRAAGTVSALQLEDARLIIDPRSPGYRPKVPAEFAAKHVGKVFAWQVKICVSASGAVDSASLVAPVHPQLDRRLLRAIAAWKYRPARLDGRPVRSCAEVAYHLTVEPADAR